MESRIVTSVKRILDAGCVPRSSYFLGCKPLSKLMELMDSRLRGGPLYGGSCIKIWLKLGAGSSRREGAILEVEGDMKYRFDKVYLVMFVRKRVVGGESRWW